MKAYRETIDWLYSDDPAALKTYADFVGISVAMAKRTRDDFFPKAAVDPDKVVGLDTIVPDAVALKFTAAPLTQGTAGGTDPDSAAVMSARTDRTRVSPGEQTAMERPVGTPPPRAAIRQRCRRRERCARSAIPYIALNPGASFRGLHDSLVNYLGNRDPQLLLCLHEEHAVAIAHGYAKVTGRPMAVAVHSNVGLFHATMAIFNAWCDRMPVLILGATGPVDAAKRRPWIDWIHTARDQGAIVRAVRQMGRPARLAERGARGVAARDVASRNPHRRDRCTSISTPRCRKRRSRAPLPPIAHGTLHACGGAGTARRNPCAKRRRTLRSAQASTAR